MEPRRLPGSSEGEVVFLRRTTSGAPGEVAEGVGPVRVTRTSRRVGMRDTKEDGESGNKRTRRNYRREGDK